MPYTLPHKKTTVLQVCISYYLSLSRNIWLRGAPRRSPMLQQLTMVIDNNIPRESTPEGSRRNVRTYIYISLLRNY